MTRHAVTRPIDLNSLLIWTNLAVLCATLLAHGEFQDHKYLDQGSLVLAIVLAMQTHLALTVERKHRDPFVILLAITMIFFFSFRLLSLALFPYSDVFERYSYSPSGSDYALAFILIANVALYAGFFLASSRSASGIETGDWRPTSFGRAVTLLLAVVVFAYSGSNLWRAGAVPRAVGFLLVFLSQYTIILLAFTYYLLYRKSVGRLASIALISLVVIEAVLHFLIGSRSAITGILQNYILATLAIVGSVRFSRRLIGWGMILLPVAAILLVGSFAISTYIRASRAQSSVFNASDAFRIATGFRDQVTGQPTLDALLPPLFARAGYFDYSAELIANTDRYKSVINLPAYGKSVVDNLLTPGFDVFDQPKVSNSLRFIYEELGTPSKKLVSEEYQSDQLGLYGELYTLFKWASLPVFFFLAFFLKRGFIAIKGINPFDLAIKRIVILYTFGIVVNSYGLDWVVIEVTPILAAIVVYKWFFKSGRRPIAWPPHRAVRLGGPQQIQTEPT